MTIQIFCSIPDATKSSGVPSGASAAVDVVDVKVTIPGSTRSDLPTYQNQVSEELVWVIWVLIFFLPCYVFDPI